MKKIVALFLILCMLVSCVSATAMTVTYTSGSDESVGVTSLTSLNGALYVLYSDGRVVSVDPATHTETPLGSVFNSSSYTTSEALEGDLANSDAGLKPMELLFTDGSTLYGLCIAKGACYTLLDDTGAFNPQDTGVALDTSKLISDDAESTLTVISRCVLNGVLYYISRDVNGVNATVGSIDLATGESKTYATQNLQDITPYKDGLLMARRYDMSVLSTATSTDNLPASEYGTFDPATDTFTSMGEIKSTGVLAGYSINGFVYHADNDTLYYTSSSRIEGMTVSSGETRTSAFTSEGLLGNYGSGTSTAYVDGGYYAIGDYNGWQVYALDTDAVKNGALRIFGEFGSNAHKSFAKNYPDIPVEVSSDYTTDLESLANAMVSENEAYDVLLLYMSYMPVEKLIAKGYCTDLSVYPEIMQRLQNMDPRFVTGMTVDGKVYGVPIGANGYAYGVNMEQWKALGLTEDDLPKTLVEFYDFVANYLTDYGEDNPDIRLFDMDGENLKMMLFSVMLDNYITYCQSELGGQMEFDNDLCREVLTAFEQIDFDELASNVDTDAADYASKPYLFSVYLPLTQFDDYYKDITPLILPLTADTKPVVGANLQVLVLNPKSKRTDDAVKYICNYLDNLDDSSQIVLHPDDNEPRIAKGYDKNVKSLQDGIDQKQALLDSAEDSQKAGLKDEIKQLQDQLDEVEAHKYSITAEQIQTFRDSVSSQLAVCQQSVLYSGDKNTQSELSKLMMQYLSGAVAQEPFLKELDQRARMMQMEDQ